MCKMSHLVSKYNKYLTYFAIHDNKLQQEIQETWTCWIHHEVERRKGGTKRSTSETKVRFTQLSLPCMYELTLCGFFL